MSKSFYIVDDADLSGDVLRGDARATALNALASATKASVGKYAAMCDIARTLGDFEDTRQTVIATVMAEAMSVTFAAAAHALSLPGATSKEAVKRDDAAEKAYASARVFWQRVRTTCEFAKPTGSGSKTGTRKPKAAPVTDVAPPPAEMRAVVVPHVSDVDDAATFLRSAGLKLAQFQKENAGKLTDAKGAAIRDAIEAFNRAVKLIQAMDGDQVTKLAKSVAKGAEATKVTSMTKAIGADVAA